MLFRQVFAFAAFEFSLLPLEALVSFQLYVLSGLVLCFLQFGVTALGVLINLRPSRVFLFRPVGLPFLGGDTRMVVIEGLVGIDAPVIDAFVPVTFREFLLARLFHLAQSLFFNDLLVRLV